MVARTEKFPTTKTKNERNFNFSTALKQYFIVKKIISNRDINITDVRY